MALIIQDDSGTVTDANSYVTVDEFKSYHSDRGNDVSSYASGDIEKALVRAADHVDTSFNFVGDKYSNVRMEWPRISAYDRSRNYLSGVPLQIKEAQSEYAFVALAEDLNPDPLRDDTGRAVESKSETVGPISESVSYAQGSTWIMPEHPKADNKILYAGLAEDNSTLGIG